MTLAHLAWLLGINAVPLFAVTLGVAFMLADRVEGKIHQERMKALRGDHDG